MNPIKDNTEKRTVIGKRWKGAEEIEELVEMIVTSTLSAANIWYQLS